MLKSNSIRKQLLKALILILIGGCLYVTIEVFYRCRSHWSMFVVGGLSFYYIGLLNEYLEWDTPLWVQAGLGSLIITSMELVCGVFVNIVFKLNVWDYSNLPCNLFGQICLPFSILWCFLAIPALLLDDLIRWKVFGEEKPHYKIL